MFNPSTEDVRRFFCQTWSKVQNKSVLTALEAIAADWLAQHPEYHSDLADEQGAVDRDYGIDAGRTNPFLHLSMHLTISEQISIDQPVGIRPLHARLSQQLGDPHQAAHEIMECLGQMIWTAQRNRTAPDGNAYLECVRRRLTKT